MRQMRSAATAILLLVGLLPAHAFAQEPRDYGDAPEGVIAYPSMGINGSFPTCVTVGPLTQVKHDNYGAYFGPAVDFELDGNGGLCPAFSPYDNDECFQDLDAGLLVPPAYTISGGVVVECVQGVTGQLGGTCQTANWGPDVDIDVYNFMPGHPEYLPAYINVLMDWNQDGQWGGSSPCPGGPAPEHVLVNFLYPKQTTGPLSIQAPPGFLIGPNPGFVWTRFTISEKPVPLDWNGEENFEDGESEDYLLQIRGQASLDHFTVYDATGADGPIVSIDDQFQSQVTDLGPTELFLVPADKNEEGIGDPFSHLTCYAITDGEPAPPGVTVTNQFVTDAPIDVGLPRELCVPTEKLIHPGPVGIDHFKCYDASGDPLDIGVGLVDQFQGFATQVLEPFLLCNPADKNGEGITNPDDHLVCYLLQPPGGFLGIPIPILNQFFPAQETIDIGEPFGLCVPSTKALVPPDADGDGVPDASDNCPTIANGPAEDNQADGDSDSLGDACDNCVAKSNPPASYPAFRTTTGGQLDDDADGYGNLCDAKFTPGPIVTALDTIQYKTAVNKPVDPVSPLSICGSPPGSLTCDQFDLDGVSPVITALDTIVYKMLLNLPVGPKCAVCGVDFVNLPCVGDACP